MSYSNEVELDSISSSKRSGSIDDRKLRSSPCKIVVAVSIIVVVVLFLLAVAGAGGYGIYSLVRSLETEALSPGLFGPFSEDVTTIFWNDIGRGESTYWDTPQYEHSLLYRRWYWGHIETLKGVYDFSDMDAKLDEAKLNGDLFAFRLMPFSNSDPSAFPSWLRTEMGDANGYDGVVWVPDHNNAAYLTALHDFIFAAAEHFRDVARWIEFIDIGGVGVWGEWHMGGLAPEPYHTDYYPNVANVQDIVDWHFEAFSGVGWDDSPRNLLMGGGVPYGREANDFPYAVSQGAGFRCDCLGNWHAGPIHMENSYPDRVAAFADHWKTAPIIWEVCWTIPQWDSVYSYTVTQVEQTFDLMLDWHSCGLNSKDFGPPPVYYPAWEDVNRFMGYRYFLADVSYEVIKSKKRNVHSFISTSHWWNSGASPIYIPATLTWKLHIANQTHELVSQENLRLWLPETTTAIVVEETIEFVEDDLDAMTLDSLELYVCLYYEPEDGVRLPIHIGIEQSRLQTDDCYLVG